MGASLVFATRGAAQVQVPRVALEDNLLGNGGFESWSLGATTQGPIPPDLWYPMADTNGLFQQGAILYTRQSADVSHRCSGQYMMEITASSPGNFVAQSVENFAEYRGKQVTFSVDFSTPFSSADVTIVIDDGMTSSQMMGKAFLGQWVRLTVVHRVDLSPTHLQFRIVPHQTVYVDEAQALAGALENAPYRPRPNPEPDLRQLPLGTVIDWYRFDTTTPVPEGFAIADGSTVTDPESPFQNLTLPNLSSRFVLGVTSPAQIGTTGGNATVDLSHDHTMAHTHSGTTGTSDFNGHDFWIQAGGAGRPALDSHRHNFTTGQPSNPKTGSALGTVSILPPFTGLLKIVRIK